MLTQENKELTENRGRIKNKGWLRQKPNSPTSNNRVLGLAEHERVNFEENILMPITLNIEPFDTELIITGQLPGARGAQILFGKNTEGKAVFSHCSLVCVVPRSV